MKRGLTARSVGLAVLLVLMVGEVAFAEDQVLQFASAPRWYFVSLQVAPFDPAPDAVFPTVEGAPVWYDHIWAYDPDDGWRHYAPNPPAGAPASLNDLETIEALRGYWIHVVQVPPGGQLVVRGDRAEVLRLEGVSVWHASGILGEPAAAPVNVNTAFAELGPAVPELIEEVWAYDQNTATFTKISSFTANCTAAPAQCLGMGRAYWFLTGGTLQLGTTFGVLPECIVLTGTSSAARIDLSYGGARGSQGSVRVISPDSPGLHFVASRRILVDGAAVSEPKFGTPPGIGPDSQADLNGDQIPETCTDPCQGAADCAGLCFGNSGSHELFVAMDATDLAAVERFSSCDGVCQGGTASGKYCVTDAECPGGSCQSNAFAKLRLELDGRSTEVQVAIRPPVLRGEYSGALVYSGDIRGSVPVKALVDDCIVENGAEDCATGRITAVINPETLGSNKNGIDDDADRLTDENNEEGGVFALRDTPGFAPDTRLYGSISGDRGTLELRGFVDRLPDLGFARGRCRAGGCTGQIARCCPDGTACASDLDCAPSTTAGVAADFANASREIELEGIRTGPETFTGVFRDRYVGVGAAASASQADGTFVLSRTRRPECLVRDPAATQSVSLGVSCRTTSDCPSRCDAGAQRGLPCRSSADCSGGSCQPFPCGARVLGGGSADARDHGSTGVDVGLGGAAPRPVTIEAAGPADLLKVSTFVGKRCDVDQDGSGDATAPVCTVDSNCGSSAVCVNHLCGSGLFVNQACSTDQECRRKCKPPFGLSHVPCGNYALTITAPGCSSRVVTGFNPCSSAPFTVCQGGADDGKLCTAASSCAAQVPCAPVALTCGPGTPAAGVAFSPTMTGGGHALTGGTGLLTYGTAPPSAGGQTLRAVGGEPAVIGRGTDGQFTNILRTLGQPVVRAGLVAFE